MTAWSAGVVAGELSADYSQVELRPGDGGHVFGMGDIGLANGGFGDYAILTTARQYGSIRLTVQVLDEEPALDPSWDAVVEFSLHTGESVSVTGWAGAGIIAVSLPSAVDVRVRYAVLDGQIARDQAARDGAGPERYLVQMWPGTQAPPWVVVSSSPWSQYWTFGGAAAGLLAELAGVPDPGRLVVVIDRALAAHPDVAGRLRAVATDTASEWSATCKNSSASPIPPEPTTTSATTMSVSAASSRSAPGFATRETGDRPQTTRVQPVAA